MGKIKLYNQMIKVKGLREKMGRIKFYKTSLDNDQLRNEKIDAVVVFGMGLNRARTEPCDQSKALTSTAAHIALQKNTPLVIVGMEQQPDVLFFRNEGRVLVDYLKQVFGKDFDKLSISILSAWSLFRRTDYLLEKIKEKGWKKILMVVHKDMAPRLKKMLKIALFSNGDTAIEILLIQLELPYNGDNFFFWKREKILNLIYEKTGLFLNSIFLP